MEPFSFERLALKQNGEKSRREARGTDGIARRQEWEREREREYIKTFSIEKNIL